MDRQLFAQFAKSLKRAAQGGAAIHKPAHRDEVPREHLPPSLAVGAVAKRLGVTPQALSAVLNGRAGISFTEYLTGPALGAPPIRRRTRQLF